MSSVPERRNPRKCRRRQFNPPVRAGRVILDRPFRLTDKPLSFEEWLDLTKQPDFEDILAAGMANRLLGVSGSEDDDWDGYCEDIE